MFDTPCILLFFQAVVRRWLAALKAQKEKWAVARVMFLSRIFATRWKLRAQKSANLANKGAKKDTLLKKQPQVLKLSIFQ